MRGGRRGRGRRSAVLVRHPGNDNLGLIPNSNGFQHKVLNSGESEWSRLQAGLHTVTGRCGEVRYGSSGQGQRAPWPQPGGSWCYQPLQHAQTDASVPVLRGGTRAQELCDCYSAIVGLETQIKACQQRHGRCHVPQAALCNHKDIAEAAPRHGPAMLDVMLTMLADEHTRCRLLEQRLGSTLISSALEVPWTCPRRAPHSPRAVSLNNTDEGVRLRLL